MSGKRDPVAVIGENIIEPLVGLIFIIMAIPLAIAMGVFYGLCWVLVRGWDLAARINGGNESGNDR